MPGQGKGCDATGVIRHRVAAALGAISSGLPSRLRRNATAITPDRSAASTSLRDAVIGSLESSPRTPPSPGWRNASSISSRTVFSSGARA